MKIYTKDSLIKKLHEIRNMGWIESGRHGNVGGIGNTLEDLLEIEENNLPLPNAGEWELKCQRSNTGSLITLFHMEPSPRALRFVPQVFLPLYGWKHDKLPDEMSFRQTINGKNRTDRGFTVIVDRKGKKILISFDSSTVASRHVEWLRSVEERVGLKELSPQPYWGFDDLHHKAGTKLKNSFFVLTKRKRQDGTEYFLYDCVTMLQNFSFDLFLKHIENGQVLIDFDARTGHNHGTKFRIRPNSLPSLYANATIVVGE